MPAFLLSDFPHVSKDHLKSVLPHKNLSDSHLNAFFLRENSPLRTKLA